MYVILGYVDVRAACSVRQFSFKITVFFENDMMLNMRSCFRYSTEACNFQDYMNAVSVLTYTPQLDDDNITLTCIDIKSRPIRLEEVSVKLNVSCEYKPNNSGKLNTIFVESDPPLKALTLNDHAVVRSPGLFRSLHVAIIRPAA